MNGFDPTFLLLIGFFALIYFLMIRPQNKAKKAHEEMVQGIEVEMKLFLQEDCWAESQK